MFKIKVKQRNSYNRWLDDVYNHQYIRVYVVEELEKALSKKDSKSVRHLYARLNERDYCVHVCKLRRKSTLYLAHKKY